MFADRKTGTDPARGSPARLSFCILLIGMIFLPVSGTTLHYRDTGEDQFVNVHLERSPSGYRVESMNQLADSMVYLLDSNCMTQSWNYINMQNGTSLSANRSHDTIIAVGTFKGRKITKTFSIDGNPWFQEWSLPVEVFARSGANAVRFWSVDPANMNRVARFELTLLAPDSIDYQGKAVPVRHIQAKLTGIGSAFFRGDYWVRESDNRVIRSRMPRGIGRKPTASDLIKESSE